MTKKGALVIGGGVAGIQAALDLTIKGEKVTLIEKEKELGGRVKELDRLLGAKITGKELIKRKLEELKKRNVKVLTFTTIKDVTGFVGNFEVTVGSTGGEGEERTFRVGTIIVATGADEMRPDGLYAYGEVDGVVTELELEAMFRDGTVPDLENVVFIQCAGARGQRVTYCSRVCCMTGIKNAMELKEANPGADVTVLYRDVVAYGISYENLYQKARERGVRFQRYPLENRPVVEPSDLEGKVRVNFRDVILGREISKDADLVVLSAPLVQHEDAPDLAKLLRVPLGQDKFFFEAHVKLRPIEMLFGNQNLINFF